MKKYNVTVNGTTYEVCVEEVSGDYTAPAASEPAFAAPAVQSTPVKAQPSAAPAATPAQAGTTPVTAPMPGTILDIKVSQGTAVKKGDVVCVLEAMKMENDIPAPADGIITSINVQKGASVASGAVLVTLK
jgi:biotin carboxyl carrier protein